MGTSAQEGVIPDKQFFKIGEVSRITGVKAHVLRYWETEFPSLRPQKTRSNQRIYRKRDVELLLQIKGLLYNEGFTIAGARKKLRGSAAVEERQERQRKDRERKAQDRKTMRALKGLRGELQDLVKVVETWRVPDSDE